MLGLTKTSAEKMDLALARDTKICKLKVIHSKYYKHMKFCELNYVSLVL